jgi:hypothetical protein
MYIRNEIRIFIFLRIYTVKKFVLYYSETYFPYLHFCLADSAGIQNLRASLSNCYVKKRKKVYNNTTTHEKHVFIFIPPALSPSGLESITTIALTVFRSFV